MITFLDKIKNNLEKKSTELKESIRLEEYVTPQIVVPNQEPFPHIVVDNFFTPSFYSDIEAYVKSVIDRGFGEQADLSRLHPFSLTGEFAYDGYLYVPRADEHQVLNFFFSVTWNQFISKIFNQSTGFATDLAIHYHPSGDRTGFVHHDYAVKYFFKGDSLPNSVVPIVTRTKEENNQMGASFGARRVIAIIMYLFGDDWQEGDGGGTGIYLSKNSEPCEVVDPKQNRLFGFHISPKSFHAFQGNKKPRVTIVQWFHVNPTW